MADVDTLTFHIQAYLPIDTLIKRRCDFDYLDGRSIDKRHAIRWVAKSRVSYDLQVIALGKTGYGKSTTLNALLGQAYFKTSEVESCTGEIQTVEYALSGANDSHVSFADFPGIGENAERDQEYLTLYRRSIKQSHVILYFLRADQRDLAIDQVFFDSVLASEGSLAKVLIVLTMIDKIEPMRRSEGLPLSEEQEGNLKRRLHYISEKLGVREDDIVAVSAVYDFGFNQLIAAIRDRTRPLLTVQ